MSVVKKVPVNFHVWWKLPIFQLVAVATSADFVMSYALDE